MSLAFAHDDQNSADQFERRVCLSEQHHSIYVFRKMSERLSALQFSTTDATRSCSAKLGVLRTGAADKDYLLAGHRLMRTKTILDRGTLDTDTRLDTVVENTVFSRDHGMEYPNDEKTRKDA